jgi:phosphatidylcholine synthase
VLAIYALVSDFDVGPVVTVVLCAIAVYIAASDAAIRLLRSLRR